MDGSLKGKTEHYKHHSQFWWYKQFSTSQTPVVSMLKSLLWMQQTFSAVSQTIRTGRPILPTAISNSWLNRSLCRHRVCSMLTWFFCSLHIHVTWFAAPNLIRGHNTKPVKSVWLEVFDGVLSDLWCCDGDSCPVEMCVFSDKPFFVFYSQWRQGRSTIISNFPLD